MRKTTEEWLHKIEALAAEINTCSDNVNAQLEEIEDCLTRAGVGVSSRHREVRVDVDGVTWALGYCRIDAAAGNAYRLAAWVPNIVAEEPRVLLSCPRAVRVAALDVIDRVLFNILERQKELLAKITSVNKPDGGNVKE